MSIAVRTIKISTRAALGTLAEEKDAAVDVKLRKNKHKSWLEPIICLPNSDEFSHPQRNTVSLGKKYGRHRNEQGSTVHVNIASDRKNESRDSGIDLELIFHEGEGDRKGGSGGRRRESRQSPLDQAHVEFEGVLAKKQAINRLHYDELVDEDTDDDGGDEPAQLRDDQRDVVDRENLPSDHAADSDGSQPDHSRHHLHHHVEDNREEVDDDLGLLPQSAQNSSESQTKDDDSDSVGSRSVLDNGNGDVNDIEQTARFVEDPFSGIDVIGVGLKNRNPEMKGRCHTQPTKVSSLIILTC